MRRTGIRAPQLIRGGFAAPLGPEDVRVAFDRGMKMFYKADSIEALAAKAGIDEDGLAATIEAYNLGQAVDDKLRVISENGSPIPNLYAAGDLLGNDQLMGRSYCGGMQVIPPSPSDGYWAKASRFCVACCINQGALET